MTHSEDLSRREEKIMDDGRYSIKEWDARGKLIVDMTFESNCCVPERKEPEKAFDDKLNKFIEKPLKKVGHDHKLISQSFHENGKLKFCRWNDGKNDICNDFFESGKLSRETIYASHKALRHKWFYENGLLKDVCYVDKKNVKRTKKWAENGQLIQYLVTQFSYESGSKTYKSLMWYDNGNLKSELFATDNPPESVEDKEPDVSPPKDESTDFKHDVVCDSTEQATKSPSPSPREISTNIYITLPLLPSSIHLREFAKEGDVEALEIYREHFSHIIGNKNEILILAAEYNKPEFLKYLRESYGFTAKDARSENNYALRIAAEKGYVEVLKELREGYGLTTKDARTMNNYALRCTAKHLNSYDCGDIKILQELKEGYGLTVEDAKVNNSEIIRDMARHNNVNGLKYIREAFGLTEWNARVMDNYALRCAAKYGHKKIIKELREGYGLGIEDARTQDNHALRVAAHNKFMSVVKEMVKFGLTKEDAKSSGNYVIRSCIERDLFYCPLDNIPSRIRRIKKGDYGNARILKEIFGLTPEDFECIDYNKMVEELVKEK